MASSSTSSLKNGSAKELLKTALPKSFFARETVLVAKELIGKVLLTRSPEGIAGGRIVETEAYTANDPACHAARGETPRSTVMFGEPGLAYVYFIYGMYEMLNFVTEPQGIPGAVLVRALEPIYGLELMTRRRKSTMPLALTSGPGKLARALGVEMSHNRESLVGPFFYVCDDAAPPSALLASPRVGIREGTDRFWRFFAAGNTFVSRAPQNQQAVPISNR